MRICDTKAHGEIVFEGRDCEACETINDLKEQIKNSEHVGHRSKGGSAVMADCAFDPETHRYTIGGRTVPSVTKVLGDLLPGWRASEFYLGRGQAVHACAALVARGIAFESDPRIAGQVEAVRRFLREVQPGIIDVESQVYSEQYLYGGTLDLTAMIPYKGFIRPCIFDYKASVGPSTIYQCAAYALAYQRHQIDLGCGIEIHDDGTYVMTELWPLDRAKREWLHLLGAYNIRARLGLMNKEDNEHE